MTDNNTDIEIVIVPFRYNNWVSDNYVYILRDHINEITIVFDPAGHKEVLAVLTAKNWQLTHILITHHHGDHIGGNKALKHATNCQIIACQIDKNNVEADKYFAPNEIITLGDIELQTIYGCGHTICDISYYSQQLQAVFAGDLLFQMGCGRVIEGTVEQLFDSLQQVAKLPPDTKLYNCHDYAYNNAQFALTIEPDNQLLQHRTALAKEYQEKSIAMQGTTLQDELDTNPFLRTNSLEVRTILNMQSASNLEVFTQIRKLKNSF